MTDEQYGEIRALLEDRYYVSRNGSIVSLEPGPRVRTVTLTFDLLDKISVAAGTKNINVISSYDHGYYAGECENTLELEIGNE